MVQSAVLLGAWDVWVSPVMHLVHDPQGDPSMSGFLSMLLVTQPHQRDDFFTSLDRCSML